MNIRKRVVLIGPTGAGKSWLGNALLNNPTAFVSSSSTSSVTDKILESSNLITLPDKKRLDLTIVDTPGIGDTKGRSHKFVDEIVTHMRKYETNMLFIVVRYGRVDVGVQKYLKALKECINGFYELSTVLIINNVPTERRLAKSSPPERYEDVAAQAVKDYGDNFSTGQIPLTILVQSNIDEDEEKFKELITNLYGAIVKSTKIPQEILRTWTETLQYYSGIIQGTISTQQALNDQIKREQDKLSRLQADLESRKKGAGWALVGQVASFAAFLIPVVGPSIALGANIACGATVIGASASRASLEQTIQETKKSIANASQEQPNAYKLNREAEEKYNEVRYYLT